LSRKLRRRDNSGAKAGINVKRASTRLLPNPRPAIGRSGVQRVILMKKNALLPTNKLKSAVLMISARSIGWSPAKSGA
jgi:hypothetical protein